MLIHFGGTASEREESWQLGKVKNFEECDLQAMIEKSAKNAALWNRVSAYWAYNGME